MRLFATDLVLLHPPSVYGFRETGSVYGPVSDVVFSTPVFEMYPIGLTSIAQHLEERGYNVRILNIAHRMLADGAYDPEAELAALHPAVFGIGLHWLPHAHGAMELARILKRHHPDTPVVFGGLSSSYFHDELIRSPFVDFVLRGDSTEAPMAMLMGALAAGGGFESIPNLDWKRADGAPVSNALSHVPARMDGTSVPDIFYVIRSVFKYGSLSSVLPFSGWMNYPMTALLTSRGCSMNCTICGGSRSAYRLICNRSRPAFRAPEALVADVGRIQRFSRAPILLFHDLRHGGRAYERRFLELLREMKPRNELVFELFYPARDDFLRRVGEAVPRWSLEITLESHQERIRRANHRFACSNEAIEETLERALENGVGRVDLFFMVGLPGQSRDDAVGCVEYCRALLERFGADRRLSFFVAPLSPFLDPGSPAYEEPERFGYRVRFRTLEQHRAALAAPSWKHVLNYETEWMTRDDIVAATYEAMRGLARLRAEYGLTDRTACDAAVARIDASEEAVAAVDRALELPQGGGREEALAAARRMLAGPAAAPRFQKDDLLWRLPGNRRFAPWLSLAAIAALLVAREVRLFTTRRLPRYLADRAAALRRRLAGWRAAPAVAAVRELD